MAWNENYTALNYLLADLYDDKDETKGLVERAGLNKGLFKFKDQPYDNWYNIISEADKQGGVIDLLTRIITKPERGSVDPSTRQAIDGIIDNLKNKKAPVEMTPEPAEIKAERLPGNFEKLMGSKSTLLPISFLEQGLICAKSVVRIELTNALGSGFLIANNWIITNHHVIPDSETAKTAEIQFNYQKTIAGLDTPVKKFKIDTGENCFYTSKEDDWTFVKLKEDANAKFGSLILSETPVKSSDFVNIIQHPAGGPKQIALYHNTVTSVDDKYVLYLTDTLNGSSGSPVFDTDWKVVALHHWGGTTKEAVTNLSVYRNRGINILRIRRALADLKIMA